MGIMSIEKPGKYGTAVMDGDLIVDFEEKPRQARTHVGNAGIYIFKQEVLELCDSHTPSLEKDLFPKLARIKQLVGFFTLGEYSHFG
jgi:mannose-1-phosphate guanylyltransferase